MPADISADTPGDLTSHMYIILNFLSFNSALGIKGSKVPLETVDSTRKLLQPGAPSHKEIKLLEASVHFFWLA